MSMTDVAPEALNELRAPDDLSALELTAGEIEAQDIFRLSAIEGVFADDPQWREAPDWQVDILDQSLSVLAEADSRRSPDRQLARLTAIETPLNDSTVVIRWPYVEERLGVELAIFEINDHVAVGFGGKWWLHYEAPQTDDIRKLESGFWSELWAATNALQQADLTQSQD